MAHVGGNLVIQRVADKLVVFDTASQHEIVIPVEDGKRLTAMAAYLTNPADPESVLIEAREQLVAVSAIGE